jgi:hypothetical protein
MPRAFQSGDFDIPMFVHDTVPPGGPDMKRLREKITYPYKETKSGGHVIIKNARQGRCCGHSQILNFPDSRTQDRRPDGKIKN